MTGLTIDSPTDQDWYKFKLGGAIAPGDSIRITSLSSLRSTHLHPVRGRLRCKRQPDKRNAPRHLGQPGRNSSGLNPVFGHELDGHESSDLFPARQHEPDAHRLPDRHRYRRWYRHQHGRGPCGALANIEDYGSILGRPLQTYGDQSWYELTLNEPGRANDGISMSLLESSSPVMLSLYDSTGTTGRWKRQPPRQMRRPRTSAWRASPPERTFWRFPARAPASYQLEPQIWHYEVDLASDGQPGDAVTVSFLTAPTQPVTLTPGPARTNGLFR